MEGRRKWGGKEEDKGTSEDGKPRQTVLASPPFSSPPERRLRPDLGRGRPFPWPLHALSWLLRTVCAHLLCSLGTCFTVAIRDPSLPPLLVPVVLKTTRCPLWGELGVPVRSSPSSPPSRGASPRTPAALFQRAQRGLFQLLQQHPLLPSPLLWLLTASYSSSPSSSLFISILFIDHLVGAKHHVKGGISRITSLPVEQMVAI